MFFHILGGTMFKFMLAALSTLFLSFAPQTASALTTNFKVDALSSKRTAIIHIPDRIIEQKIQAPVLFALHGPGTSAFDMEMSGRLIAEAESRGFILVVPDGSMRENYSGMFWNVEPFLEPSDDYALMTDEDFITMLVRHLEGEGVLDQGRIFAGGFSMGGMMAYKLACSMPETFSAIAVVSGALMTDDCNPAMPVSLLEMHGMQDVRVPYFGGETRFAPGVVWPAVMSTINEWKQGMACDPAQGLRTGVGASCSISSCANGQIVQHCVAYEGGHEWPGRVTSKAYRVIHGEPVNNINATSIVFDFFEQVPGRGVVAAP